MKYVFVTGGVVSSIGKGITAAALGKLLHARGYKTNLLKLDIYYNAEPSLLNPLLHGESFITDDGTAADLDIGHYERIVDVTLSGESSFTTGRINRRIMEKEWRGEYEGAKIQAIPHVTDEIKACIQEVAAKSGADIQIVEIGGTVGDMEVMAYVEAIRQMRWVCESLNDCCYIHVTLMPFIATAGELKTKPIQNSVKVLRSMGIQPDVIVCRTEKHMTTEAKDKVALFCNVKTQNVIQNLESDGFYELPVSLEKQGLAKIVLDELKLEDRGADLSAWDAMLKRKAAAEETVYLALVCPYPDSSNAYLSVLEALHHAATAEGVKADIATISAEDLDDETSGQMLAAFDAFVLPGGFETRGADGVMIAAKYARENRVPVLAIGLGMQLALAEAAQTILGLDANSTEIDPATPHPVVHLPEGRRLNGTKAPVPRMGGMEVRFVGRTLRDAYGCDTARERHSNGYEVNPAYIAQLESAGFKQSAVSEDGQYAEAFTLEGHPFFCAVLYHPEYLSRPNRPHPLFVQLIRHAIDQ
ncbi:MAG TPA: CTP synthase [Candidatus Limiplasma sp.]|nr:CTP synthase [Candidatus Limiplasma sp.]HRX09829.1 CTP synthase [Candidatus Limiplasma sp.]